jgi:hypothetical protein
MSARAWKNGAANSSSAILADKPPLIPVLHIENIDHAEPILETLVEARIAVIEVTLCTTTAIKVIERMRRLATQARIGAGTITLPEQFDRIRDVGAEFGVSPALRLVVHHLGGQVKGRLCPQEGHVQPAAEPLSEVRRVVAQDSVNDDAQLKSFTFIVLAHGHGGTDQER